jgi:hypothetical protein
MRLNERMRYPHPVLSEYSSDYISGEFRCAFEQNLTPENELRLVADLAISDATLTDLIADQKAATGYFIVCRRTYFNYLQVAPLGKSEKFFDATKLFGTVLLRPIIWTLEPLDSFQSPLFDPEFGPSAKVAKGSVIALGPEFRFSMDRKKYKPFDSIFELAENPAVVPGTFDVDPDQDRITITAEPETYRSVADMRNPESGRAILLSAVYMPAVMEVLARMQTGDQSLEGRKWYRVFRAKCDNLGINPYDNGRSPLQMAQKLLRQPLKKAITIMERAG